MRVFEQLLDLGANGVFAITSAGGYYGAIPGESHGRARLLRGTETLDRLEACTRAVPVETQRAQMAGLRGYLAGAVEGVQRQLAWAEARISERFREMPSQVVVLDDHHVLIRFSAIAPYAFRVVDVVEGRVCWEMHAEALRKAGGIPEDAHLRRLNLDEPLIREGGGGKAVMQIGARLVVYEWDGSQLGLLEWTARHDGYASYHVTADHVLREADHDRHDCLVLDRTTGETVGTLAPRTRSKYGGNPMTSAGSNRIGYSHRGGTIDIIDGADARSIRPYPRAGRNEDLGGVLSYSGRYLGIRAWTTFRVVDLERQLVAEIDSPQPNLSDDPDKVLYDSDMIAADSRVVLVSSGDFTFHEYDSLRWEPVVEPGRKASASKAPTEYRKYLSAWAKPALALAPAKKGRSHLYGMASLPPEEIPRHEHEPMMLLAEIDLAEAARALPDNPWPKEGLLCFFAAADGEGSIREDESFNPLAYRVVWHRGPAVEPADKPLTPAQPMAMKAHRANLPDTSSAIVEGAHLDEANLEAYREHLEKKGWLDQPNGHRLGGYPTILQNNDLEAQAAVKAGDLDDYPRDMAEVAMVARWRLLLQLDSDDEFMWGTDSGTLYFLVQEDDLARGDFSRVVGITEGY
jgi:uncharacterized protein YwqG